MGMEVFVNIKNKYFVISIITIVICLFLLFSLFMFIMFLLSFKIKDVIEKRRGNKRNSKSHSLR